MLRKVGLVLLATTTALWPGSALAMPGVIEAITFLSLAAQAGALGAGIAAVASAFLPTLIGIGVSVGLSALASGLFRPQTGARPEDMQQSSRQPTQPRARHYGRVKVSGPWVFAEAGLGNFYKVIALGQGPIDGIEQFWIDDSHVAVDGGGDVTTAPWDGHATIHYRLGAETETAYSGLSSVFDAWTAAHRGDGIASLYVAQYAMEQGDYLEAFPNGINTNYRVVMRGAKVWIPTTGTMTWTDNATAIIRDYMSHADGMRLPSSIFTTPLAQAGWETAYSRAAASVALAGGGGENRYRLWGSYLLSERPADVLGRMLECCDGRLVPTPDGGLTLDIGEWYEPTVIIDEDAIVGFSDLSRGRDILTAANTVRATFLDPNSDYQAADADPWVDADDVSARGELVLDKRFEMAPSHSQCRRLMKLAYYRANPSWTGTFRLNLRGLEAFGERLIRIRYPLFGIDGVFEVQDFRFDVADNILVGVTLTVQSMPQAAYQWDASQEEGDAPVADESEGSGVPDTDPPSVSFVSGPKAQVSFDPPPSELYRNQVRYRTTGVGDWTLIAAIPQEDTTAETATLAGTTAYEFQVRLVTAALGIPGAWSASTAGTTP